jgi:hypothetical protein
MNKSTLYFARFLTLRMDFLRRPRQIVIAALLTSQLISCVSLDQLPPGAVPGASGTGVTNPTQSFPDIDPGGTQLTTLHFTLKGYTENEIRPISTMAESLYNKIGSDTGLYSFLASGSYGIVIYRDRDEYLKKTRLPEWSRAAAVNGTIYVYPGSDLEPVMAHEMTHLIFASYMGTDKARTFRWLNEGLAMYEELQKVSESERSAFQSRRATELRRNRMAFSQMTFFVPVSEQQRLVDVWYQQVESVVAFMLAGGSALNFANMLNSLKTGADMDKALADNYPAKFRSLTDLENSWKYSI